MSVGEKAYLKYLAFFTFMNYMFMYTEGDIYVWQKEDLKLD